MSDQPEFPGPGEHVGPDNIQAEASTDPISDGEMPGIDPAQDQRRCTLEMQPITSREANDVPEAGNQSTLRQTGTDHDALRPIQANPNVTEQRLDHSVTDAQREDSLDPAQDDSGPHSDQG